MQHIIVIATPEDEQEPVKTQPSVPKVFRDDQFMRFLLGPETEWDTESSAVPIVFNDTRDPFLGGPVLKDVKDAQGRDTYIVNSNNALAAGATSQVYGVTYFVKKMPIGIKIRHDPEVGNEPQP
ncbi:MAG TPA: hypothetical protein VJZ00_05260 [Thermoanaerobaculia bacterium]|nr:hypothetical protein [Thermoanaerobaculia bacterium]